MWFDIQGKKEFEVYARTKNPFIHAATCNMFLLLQSDDMIILRLVWWDTFERLCYYAPNFEEVEGAYCFRVVVCPWFYAI